MDAKFSRAQAGWFVVGGKCYYFKSKFERRWACVLEICKRTPDISIGMFGFALTDWQYEPRRFNFFGPDIPKKLQGKKLGVRVYKPDFYIEERRKDKVLNTCWFEAKIAWGQKDKTKLTCFKTYYPDERLIVVIPKLTKARFGKAGARRFSQLHGQRLGYEIITADGIFNTFGRWLESKDLLIPGEYEELK